VAAVGLSIFGRKNTAGVAATREALQAAARLKSDDRVWLTERVAQGEHGDPSIAKSLGFYAPPLLRNCESPCESEAAPGALVSARSDEAEEIAERMGGRIDYSNKTVALVRKLAPAQAEPAR